MCSECSKRDTLTYTALKWNPSSQWWGGGVWENLETWRKTIEKEIEVDKTWKELDGLPKIDFNGVGLSAPMFDRQLRARGNTNDVGQSPNLKGLIHSLMLLYQNFLNIIEIWNWVRSARVRVPKLLIYSCAWFVQDYILYMMKLFWPVQSL